MIDEKELLQKWHKDKACYKAWGEYLAEKIQKKLEEKLGISYQSFLKMPVIPRLKSDESLVEKALVRKTYDDPYSDITDKVGIRFVVLLKDEMHSVIDSLKEVSDCRWENSRDSNAEQKENPWQFVYSADHYIVWSKCDIVYNNTKISANTPCEVQIKTLLDHAYSELTHDRIYKTDNSKSSEMYRNAAKAKALIEATSDYFEIIAKDNQKQLTRNMTIGRKLSKLYLEQIGTEPDISSSDISRLNDMVINMHEVDEPDQLLQRVVDMLAEKTFIIKKIKYRLKHNNNLAKLPCIFLVYLGIFEDCQKIKREWKMQIDDLEPFLNDLGYSVV